MNFADSIKANEYILEHPAVVSDREGETYEEWENRTASTKREISCNEVMDAVATSIYEEIVDLGVIADIIAIKVTKRAVEKLFGEGKDED